MKLSKIVLLSLILFLIGIVKADINIDSIVSPTPQWYDTFSLTLNVTTNDNANVIFTTTKNPMLTNLYADSTQGNLTLNSTFLQEGSNTITIYAKNASDQLDLDIAAVAGVNIDVSAPLWSVTPSSQNHEFGDSYHYDLNATDLQTITFSINSTIFSINSSGDIINTTNLSINIFYLQINATDPLNQTNTSEIYVNVQDTLPPVWENTPQNQTLVYRTSLNYNLNATDPSGISSYFINDTSNFTINSSGFLKNTTFLPEGNYSLNISVNDTLNFINSQPIIIIVSSCVENWDCTSWGICASNARKRTCTDLNKCGTFFTKPSETLECDSGGGGDDSGDEEEQEESDSGSSSPSSDSVEESPGGAPSIIKTPKEEIEVVEVTPEPVPEPEEKQEPLNKVTGNFIEKPPKPKKLPLFTFVGTIALMCAVGTFVYYRFRKNRKKPSSFGF